MILQLTVPESELLASQSLPRTDPANDGRKVLQALGKAGKEPFTRRDITSVMRQMGYGVLSDADWYLISKVVDECAQKVPQGRGYYRLKGAVPAVQPAPTPAPKVAPPVRPTKSLTSQWIEKELVVGDLLNRVTAILYRTYQLEGWEELMSFAGLWLAKFGHKGTCDKYIAEGNPPTPAIL